MAPGPISFEDFAAVDIRIGRVLSAELSAKAKQPAYTLVIEFEAAGTRTSSAQLTANDRSADLVGRHVLAVCHFPPKRVARGKSEALVLAALCPRRATVLLKPLEAGSRVR